ncbi:MULTISPECIES: DUF4395 domain-containing protein [Bacillaceae]|uniref:DUF4395 domain-containing protein n=1 Tax=Bacillaceae TaxID=186817 RepID=UPI001F3D5459|nr:MULTISPECIES: DUF4395 domain-containing protein [Bacillaceae]MCF2648868.1 DUF4395 domain-containing protein [Niallia circulans]MCM3362401.1 DUF4395 domain-containing protein [Niallia sp. MER TA 168]CAI9395892.1 hypothetical protein BACSP_04196 [Bacillus sp. T2.9-1]
MTTLAKTIPQPLVRTNQWIIFLSVLLSLFMQQYWILLIPLLAGLGGLLFQWNPIMKLASLFLQKPRKEYRQEDWDQQQFNQIIAVVCLAVGSISFFLNWTIVGYIFTIMVWVASIVAILGFCIGCFIRFQWKRYQYNRSL